MKLKKLTERGIAHYVTLLAVVVLVAIAGTFMLVKSHADTPNYLGFANYTNASGVANRGRPILYSNVSNTAVRTVFTSQDFLPGIGAQYVSDITPGGKLTYSNLSSSNLNSKVYYTQICYYVRAYNSPKSSSGASSAPVIFSGIGNSVSRSLPVDSKYRSVCVPSGSRKSQTAYNIWNRSSAAYVLVYQAVTYY